MMVSALLEREQGAALPIRNGAFVAVVGPSGAGKDTLIAHAKAALADEPQVDFVRRVITRLSRRRDRGPRHAGGRRISGSAGRWCLRACLGGARIALRPASRASTGRSRTAMWRSPMSRAARCRRCASATPMSPSSRSPPTRKSWRRGLPAVAANCAARFWPGSRARVLRHDRTVHSARQQRAEGDRRRQARRHHPQGDGVRRYFRNCVAT